MPDWPSPQWQEIVRSRLAGLALDPADRDEVEAELVAHLEETHEAFRAEGLTEQHAVQRTLAQAGNWQDLQRRISLAKNGGLPMKNRLHQIWFPGLLIFALFTISLFLFASLPASSRCQRHRLSAVALASSLLGGSGSLSIFPRRWLAERLAVGQSLSRTRPRFRVPLHVPCRFLLGTPLRLARELSYRGHRSSAVAHRLLARSSHRAATRRTSAPIPPFTPSNPIRKSHQLT